jgi:hypothetical protein
MTAMTVETVVAVQPTSGRGGSENARKRAPVIERTQMCVSERAEEPTKT